LGLDDSTLIWNRSTRYRPRPTLLDIGLGPLYSHWLRLALLDISWGSLYSTSDQARSTRHRTRPALLDIGPGPLYSILARPKPINISPSLLDSTLAQAHSSWPGRLDIGGPLGSISTRAPSTQQQLSITPGPDDSTLAMTQTTQHQPEPRRLGIGLGPLGLTSRRTTRYQAGPKRFDIDLGPLN